MKVPKLIAFEGVDGAGKTTVLSLVAKRLKQRGLRVFLPRDGKEHSSHPARLIREFTRDVRNIDLTPRAELALYCAREAQVLDELVKPALSRGEIVLVDRSLLTPVVLGAFGRGLHRETCESMYSAAADGLEPDLTMIFDVHPRTSRLRKRIEKVRGRGMGGGGGRKGLSGSGLKERLREGYLTVAAERNLPVFHAERATPDEIADRVVALIEHGIRPEQSESAEDARPQWLTDPSVSFLDALTTVPPAVALFLANGLIAGRQLRKDWLEKEPQLVAWSLDAEDPLRNDCVHAEVDYALRGWSKRPLTGPDDLRYKLLELYPDRVIGTLKYQSCKEAEELRSQYADRAPAGVLVSLAGREDAHSMKLRRQCWKDAPLGSRAASLALCGSEEAWKLREKVLERSIPVGLESLRGVDDRRANDLLEAYANKAEKSVLRALSGRTDRFAHQLRRSMPRVGHELVDSIRGIDDEESWKIREEYSDRYPSTVIHSLAGIESPRATSMRSYCEHHGRGDLHVARRSIGLDEFPVLPGWARTRAALAETD